MDEDGTRSIRESYDRLAEEYARRIFNELQHKPLDRELLDRFAAALAGRGDICDMGCGPGHVIAMDFFLFQTSAIRHHLENAGLAIEEIIERGPYAPEIEYQSQRAYIFARKPSAAG